MHQLLQHIKSCLKDYKNLQFTGNNQEKSKIQELTQKLQNENLIPQSILKLVIGDESYQNILKSQMLNYLRQIKSDEEISLLCRSKGRIIREPYCILTNKSSLIKEIIDSINLIQNDLDNLTTIIDCLVRQNDSFTCQTQSAINPQQYSLYLLLVETMQLSILLPNDFQELISQLYLLEQSIYLIVQKTQKVLEQLTNKTEQDKNQSQSVRSQVSNKKSTLSESLLIFKEKQRRDVKQQILPIPNSNKLTVIRSDFQFCRPIEKTISKKDRRSFCCF